MLAKKLFTVLFVLILVAELLTATEAKAQSKCGIYDVNISPPSPQPPGTIVSIHAGSSFLGTDGLCYDGTQAMRLFVNGVLIAEHNSYQTGQIDATWDTSSLPEGQYTITIQGQVIGGQSWSGSDIASEDFTYTLSGQNNTKVAPDFGIIQIGPDIFVIIMGERRLVPNPDTLDALGISRDMIDNMGLSDAQLAAIPRGADIPDISRDPNGFQAFMNEYGSIIEDLKAKIPITQSPRSQNPSAQTESNDPIIQELQIPQTNESTLDKIVSAITSLFGGTDVKAAPPCEPQCMLEVQKQQYRPDICQWVKCNSSTDPMDVLRAAQISSTVHVRNPGEQPQKGDLIIWTSDVLNNGTGHIGVVTSVGPGSITVHDSNWNLDCKPRDLPIPIETYLKFVSSPNQGGSNESSGQPKQQSANNCSNPSGWNIILCKIGWYGK